MLYLVNSKKMKAADIKEETKPVILPNPTHIKSKTIFAESVRKYTVGGSLKKVKFAEMRIATNNTSEDMPKESLSLEGLTRKSPPAITHLRFSVVRLFFGIPYHKKIIQ